MNIAIIGGGASGLACAVECGWEAARQYRKVNIAVFEAADRVGKKILATGNGRCNLMNENEKVTYFGDDEFARFALKKYNLTDNLSFFAAIGLCTRSDSEGRIYPLSNQASSVLDALRFECERFGIRFECSKNITEIKSKGNRFEICGENFDKVVLACGGKAGVKGYQSYDLLKKLGHSIVTPRPALTKINVKEVPYVKQLKGIRHKGELTLYIDGKRIAVETGEVQFTDYGLSGIAIMQLSSYITREKSKDIKIVFDTVPDFLYDGMKEFIIGRQYNNGALSCENLLTAFMPKKLGAVIMKICGISLNTPISALNNKNISDIINTAQGLTFTVEGLRSFEDAQVTAGGADTREFDSTTMESKKVKGLYCVGEMLNVDGLCGGYNLMWAWSSGRLCGKSLLK